MKYNQLVSSIQSNIKRLIYTEGINAPRVTPFTEIILKSKKPNNLFHSYQGNGKIIPVSETNWENRLILTQHPSIGKSLTKHNFIINNRHYIKKFSI